MSITSFSYFIFVLFTYLISTRFKYNSTLYKIFIIVASYYFYATYDVRFCIILLFVTIINFAAGHAIESSISHILKKIILSTIVVSDIGILFIFKYYDFFLHPFIGDATGDMVSSLFGTVVPIGISFIIFQALTYPLDVYRGRIAASNTLLDFTFFLVFFPQLLSGPIVRAAQFLPQTAPGRSLDRDFAASGLSLVFMGLVKKIALADVIAAHIVDPAFAQPAAYSPVFLAIGILAYSIQIYLDLSGYTDMARGVGRLFGYDLPINFERPYLATSVSNFWQRWHITMSSFFRDYLYFGIGGSKSGNVYVNLLVTFIAIGLWHGAGWNFVLYGALHGSMVGFERWLRGRRKSRGSDAPNAGWLVPGSRSLSILLCFLFVATSRLLFRGGTLAAAGDYLKAMANWQQPLDLPLTPLGLAALIIGIGLHLTPIEWRERFLAGFGRLPSLAAAALLAGAFLLFVALSEGGTAFIYFQF